MDFYTDVSLFPVLEDIINLSFGLDAIHLMDFYTDVML